MKKLLITIIFTIAFISVPYTDSANNNMNVQARVNTIDEQTRIIIKRDIKVQSSNRLIKHKFTAKKISGLNEKLTANGIPAEKREKLFGLLLLAYGGKK